MASKQYLSPVAFRFLAHRGLAVAADGALLDENSAAAFARALEVGATHLETDVQASKDGVAVICHDSDLLRIAGVKSKVADLTWQQLSELRLEHGSAMITLEQALSEFKTAKFNIDIKFRRDIVCERFESLIHLETATLIWRHTLNVCDEFSELFF